MKKSFNCLSVDVVIDLYISNGLFLRNNSKQCAATTMNVELFHKYGD